jgi:hypothetical protein
MIAGHLRPGTAVRPPAHIPASRVISEARLMFNERLEYRTYSAPGPATDSGPAAVVARIKRQVGKRLFLTGAAVACVQIPRSALAVYDYIYTRPSYRGEIDNLYTSLGAEGPQDCDQVRLRISDWQGVRVHDSHAQAGLTGRIEKLDQGEWSGHRIVWRLELRRVGTEWKIAVEGSRDLDYKD